MRKGKKKKIKVGLDFDGVVAYNPLRIFRAPLAYFKKNVVGIKKLKFWYPKQRWQQFFWIVLHESSIFPAKGADLLKKMVKEGSIEAHLVTARYSFLDTQLDKWLKKHGLKKYFKTINVNIKDEQPHLFKERMIKKLKVEYFIEDNWDIVNYIDKKLKIKTISKKTKICWIYNILDRGRVYKYKFPYLNEALRGIIVNAGHKKFNKSPKRRKLNK